MLNKNGAGDWPQVSERETARSLDSAELHSASLGMTRA